MSTVKELYSRWTYPDPIDDIGIAIKNGWFDFGDPSLIWNLYWPKESPRPIDILIAGCGTHQAAYYAYKNPDCKVIGIDISKKSLAHQEYLKSKHDLKNLTLENLDILDINDSFSDRFDLIVSTGVIHHIADNEKALKKLKSCLKSYGRINLMVYGKYPRIGIYMLQEVFKILKLEVNDHGLDMVKHILSNIPEWHFAKEYINKAGDLSTDPGLADTFLNPVDKSFSISDIFQMIQNADLEFVDWNDRLHYSIEAVASSDPVFKKMVENLDSFDRYRLTELLVQQLATHRLILSQKNRSQKIKIDLDRLKHIIPTIRYDFYFDRTRAMRAHHILSIDEKEYSILAAIDNKKTISDIIDKTELDQGLVVGALKKFQEFGHVIIIER